MRPSPSKPWLFPALVFPMKGILIPGEEAPYPIHQGQKVNAKRRGQPHPQSLPQREVRFIGFAHLSSRAVLPKGSLKVCYKLECGKSKMKACHQLVTEQATKSPVSGEMKPFTEMASGICPSIQPHSPGVQSPFSGQPLPKKPYCELRVVLSSRLQKTPGVPVCYLSGGGFEASLAEWEVYCGAVLPPPSCSLSRSPTSSDPRAWLFLSLSCVPL